MHSNNPHSIVTDQLFTIQVYGILGAKPERTPEEVLAYLITLKMALISIGIFKDYEEIAK